MKRKNIIRIIEFFIIGVLLGIVEDLIAIKFITNEPITYRVILIAAAVALPFAIFSELIVDHPKFWKKVFKKFRK